MNETFVISFLYTLSLLPPAYLRYAPFRTLIDEQTKNRLFLGYGVIFFLETIFIMWLFFIGYLGTERKTFYMLYNFSYLPYVIYTVFMIRPFWFQHLFVLGLQAMYMGGIHSALTLVYNEPMNGGEIIEYFLIYIFIFCLGLLTIRNLMDHILIKDRLMYHVEVWKWLSPVPLLLVYYQGQVMSMESTLGFDNYWQHLFQIIVFVLFSYALKNVVHRLHSMEEVFRESREARYQMQFLGAYATKIREEEKQLRIIRHDTRHHLLILADLVGKGNFEEAEAFIEDLQEEEKA